MSFIDPLYRLGDYSRDEGKLGRDLLAYGCKDLTSPTEMTHRYPPVTLVLHVRQRPGLGA